MHRRCRMSDEKPVPETLETIAASIRELRQSMDSQFGAVDKRFDEVKAQLRTEIEAVRGDVRIVAEGLAAQTALLTRMDTDRERLAGRVENHDLRILALERTETD